MIERRVLQTAVLLASIAPIWAGVAGVIWGTSFVWLGEGSVDLGSHFRFLSGVLLGIGLGFASCVPTIERHMRRYWMLGAIVVLGGLARLADAIAHGLPSAGHIFGLIMELGVVPALMVWQWRYAVRAQLYSGATDAR